MAVLVCALPKVKAKYLWLLKLKKMKLKLIEVLPWCFDECFCAYFGDLRLGKAMFS